MTLRFECQLCGQPISATPDQIGVTTTCPGCNASITVPNPLAASTTPPTLPIARPDRIAGPTIGAGAIQLILSGGIAFGAALLSPISDRIIPLLALGSLRYFLFAVVSAIFLRLGVKFRKLATPSFWLAYFVAVVPMLAQNFLTFAIGFVAGSVGLRLQSLSWPLTIGIWFLLQTLLLQRLLRRSDGQAVTLVACIPVVIVQFIGLTILYYPYAFWRAIAPLATQ